MASINDPAPAKHNGTGSRTPEDRAASDRFRQQTREATKDFEDIAVLARDAQEKIGQWSDDATGYYEQGEAKVRELRRGLEQFIQEKPVKTVLIAAGIGLVLGRFWMRR